MSTVEKTWKFQKFPVPLTRVRFKNGLELFNIKTASLKVTVMIVVKVGSLDDCEYPNLSHLLEHILYTGPVERSRGFHPYLKELFTKGVDAKRASTHPASTQFVLEGALEDWREIITALWDICLKPPPFSEEMIAHDLEIIEVEIRQKSSPRSDWLHQHLLPHLPHAYQTTELIKFLGRINADTAARFYLKHYQPYNIAVIVAGNVDDEELTNLVSQLACPHQQKGEPAVRKGFYPAWVTDSYVGTDAPTGVSLYFPYPADRAEQNHLRVATNILFDYPGGLVFEDMRHQQELIYSANAQIREWPDLSWRVMMNGKNRGNLDKIHEGFFKIVERVINGDYPPALLDRIRQLVRLAQITDQERLNPSAWINPVKTLWVSGQLDDVDDAEIQLRTNQDQIGAVVKKYLKGEYARIETINPNSN